MIRKWRHQKLWILIATAAVWIVPGAALHGHRFHTVYAEVERISDSGELQLAIRVAPEDLAAAYRLEKPEEQLDPDTLSPPDDWITHYLNKAILFRSETDDKWSLLPKLKWVGMERLETETWIYLEGSLLTGLRTTQIRSHFFFEFEGALSNIIVLREGDWRKTLHCSPILNAATNLEKPSTNKVPINPTQIDPPNPEGNSQIY